MASALPGARMAPQLQQPRPSLRSAAAGAASISSAPAAWLDSSPLSQVHGPVVAERRLGSSQWAEQLLLETRDGARFFAKTAGGGAAAAEMFRGEMLGLNALRDASDVSGAGLAVPRVFFGGRAAAAAAPSSASSSSGGGGAGRGAGGEAFIVMEHLDLSGGGGGGRGGDGRTLQARLGEALARVHGAPVPPPTTPLSPPPAGGPDSSSSPYSSSAAARAPQFGFPVDNTIGGTPQLNGWSDSWPDFYRDRRLLPQLRLAADPALSAAAQPVLDNLPLLFRDYGPGGSLEGRLAPSALHGDLWSGNYGAAREGGQGGTLVPAVFDPAAYYGHSEAEFGMQWCGGFAPEFWAAYFALRPRAPGFDARSALYELYHYLNHLNLFGGGGGGGGYRAECARCLERLAAVVRAGGVPAR